MSKNMVERVARAMARRRQERHDLAPPWWSDDGPQPADTIMLWEDEKEVFRDDARAAIEAMASPTEAMVEAAHIAEPNPVLGGYALEEDGPGTIWNAMITAALKP